MKGNQNSKLGIVRFHKNEDAIWEIMMGAIFTVIVIYAVLNIGTFINGSISSSLIETYPDNYAGNATGVGARWRTTEQNNSVDTLHNISGGYDTNIKMSNIAVQIAVITLPLMAVVAIRRFI